MHIGSILLCVIIYVNLSSTFKSLSWVLATTINFDFINLSVMIGHRDDLHRDAIKLSVTAVRPFSTASVEKKQTNLYPRKCLLVEITQVSIAANQSRVNVV